MFVTVECEATVIGCRTVRPELDATLPCVLALPGADHVLERLPADRWALVCGADGDTVRASLEHDGLPAPSTIVTLGADAERDVYLRAAAALHTDPHMCLALEDTPAGVAAARTVGMQVVGVATEGDPDGLAAADFVIPSLLSVRVLGTHPFAVFEVDAIPDVGTHATRRR